MYAKLIFRGLFRHRKKGKRLFILLALCTAAVIFTLTFQSSFSTQYEAMGIDIYTGHLAVLPLDSPKLKEGFFGSNREKLALINYKGGVKDLVERDGRIESSALLVETTGMMQTLENEGLPFYGLIGVEPSALEKIFPGSKILSQIGSLDWQGPGTEVPLFRPAMEFWEKVPDSQIFVRSHFKPKGKAWEDFKGKVCAQWSLGAALDDESFLKAINLMLQSPEFPAKAQGLVESQLQVSYSESLDNALRDYQGNQSPSRDISLRKRVIRALYPQAVTPILEEPSLGIPLTLTIPPASSDEAMTQPVVLPGVYKGFVQRFPMYFWNSFIDVKALRDALGLKPWEGTSLYIRVKDKAQVPGLKADLERALALENLDYKVVDYQFLGKTHMATAQAFGVIGWILIGLFLVTVAIFIINNILLSLLQRRREIGTSVALGLSPFQNLLVFLGETALLVLVSWIIGAVLGGLLVWLMTVNGLPGMVFFPKDTLYFQFNPGAFLDSLVLIFVTTVVSAVIPLTGLLKLKPVELLKEGQ